MHHHRSPVVLLAAFAAGFAVLTSGASAQAGDHEPRADPPHHADRAERETLDQFVEFARQLVHDGRTPEGVRAIEDRMRELDAELPGSDPYALAKARVLSWLDRDAEAKALIDAVPDDALTEPTDLANRIALRMLDPPAAEALARRLAEARPERFAQWAHDALGCCFVQWRLEVSISKGQEYSASTLRPTLLALERSPSAAVREIVSPLGLWDLVLETNDSDTITRALSQLSLDPLSRADRYSILLADELAARGDADTAAAELRRILNELQARPELAAPSPERDNQTERARTRALVVGCSTRLAELEPAHHLEHLARAAEYSPDAFDLRRDAAFYYEQKALGSARDYRPVYAEALADAGRAAESASQWLAIATTSPNQMNLARERYQALLADGRFDERLALQREDDLPPLPDLPYLRFDGSEGKLSELAGRWLLLDFWGVWCGPCVAEMPELNRLAHRIRDEAGDRARVLALSYRDTPETVERFLQDRGYDLPVARATDELVEAFGIAQFPTKVIVTPGGRWFAISAGGDWAGAVERLILTPPENPGG